MLGIFILLYLTFGTFRHAGLVSRDPLRGGGGVFILCLGTQLQCLGGHRFHPLFGVAMLNGIVMVSSLNEAYKVEGGWTAAVSETAATRLRPVLMTALVASLGFLPMALSHGTGAEIQKPLATVVIGGLITATLMTLVVLPVFIVGWRGNSLELERGGTGHGPREDDGRFWNNTRRVLK
jgi:cobalt-zinc-cadmium resistance protein CzcA